MDKRFIQEDTRRGIVLGLLGFAALMMVLPEWAREGVLFFAAVYALLVIVVDANVRALVRNWVPGHRRSSGPQDDRARGARDDLTSARAKPLAARRVAT